jgi:ATP-dependent RNA helicase SUPV3L1/SUV3
VRCKSDKQQLSQLVVPVTVKLTRNPDDINVGEELTGCKLEKDDILKTLNAFFRRPPIRKLAEENGLDSKLFLQAFSSFRKCCLESEQLTPELHIVLNDIVKGFSHVDDLFPFFINHARIVFPHLECIDELKKISDSRLPHAWFPEARAVDRKIVFHSGPTNSGKTYNAMKSFLEAESGVYCGPLKLLAVEVNTKANEAGTPCDLVTGEERTYAIDKDHPASHIACTVEMASTTMAVDVAIIDEIQMIRDPSRGWAWTRALLGIPAKEVHVCGEEAAVDIIKDMVMGCGEEVEVRRYNRLTKLELEKEALCHLANVRPGDCIVCFSKSDIFHVTLALEKMGKEVAVIYGGLPPYTKLAQAKRFNDPNDKCKVLVATDAVGMGLNLSINRVIFWSVTKMNTNEKGEMERTVISVSQALQIGGRAGRYNTIFDCGKVTTYKPEDLKILNDLFSTAVDPIAAAGIHPTADQIELFAYHLPDATLSNLIDIFVSMCQLDSAYYFMCNVEDFKFLADMIQHVPLPLRTRYVFCCAPINRNYAFVCTMFVKFAKMYSQNEPITMDWLCRNIDWPLARPGNLAELVHLEQVFDVLDLYLWLSYRFPDLFPEQELVRDMQRDLDQLIYSGVAAITKLLKASEAMQAAGVTKSSAPRTEVAVDIQKVMRTTSLTDQLVSSGVLTPEMLEKLKREWRSSSSSSGSSDQNRSKK